MSVKQRHNIEVDLCPAIDTGAEVWRKQPLRLVREKVHFESDALVSIAQAVRLEYL